jgi:hypothetical protein
MDGMRRHVFSKPDENPAADRIARQPLCTIPDSNPTFHPVVADHNPFTGHPA